MKFSGHLFKSANQSNSSPDETDSPEVNKTEDHYYAVIIAGGSGTRLWPKSRKKEPKHLLDLFGNGSLLQATYKRISAIIPDERIVIVTLEAHVNLIKKQIPQFLAENIIAEPEAKGTAMAMGLAAAFIKQKDEDGVIFNLWADQVLDDPKKFEECLLTAFKAASKKTNLVTVGVKPTFPHTGLGYIRIGEQIELEVPDVKDPYVFKSKGFKEKPNLVTAQSFIASGEYLWNTGLYCWSVQAIFDAFELHSPGIFSALQNLLKDKITTKTIAEAYKNVGNPNAIDYEVSEKARNILVVPGNFGWSDVGDWKVVYDSHDKDPDGNVYLGDKNNIINIGSEKTMVEVNGRMIAIVGLTNIAVIDTDDALLICPMDKTQDVKKVVEKLKEEKREEYL